MTKKNTLYEVLEVTAITQCQDIEAAYQRKLAELQADEGVLSREEYVFRQKLLELARTTLSDPQARREYDDKLMARISGAEGKPPGTGMSLVAVAEDVDHRAEAIALQAGALALGADAMNTKTDVAPYRPDLDSLQLPRRSPSRGRSPLRSVVVALGTLAAIGIVTQLGFVYFAVRKTENNAAAAAKAEEQLAIQEYYQKYGVRPASAAEARLLEEEKQRKAREEQMAEYAKRQEEDETRRFQEESRRMGERVSSELRYAEELNRREEALKKMEKEEEERRRQWEEQERIEREKEKWRSVLSR